METETIFFFELENKSEFSRPSPVVDFPLPIPKILIFISDIVLQNGNPDFLNFDRVCKGAISSFMSLDGQYFRASHVEPEHMDLLWANGWRHFGSFFFRYSTTVWNGQVCTVLPLRIDLEHFCLSKSQKRVLARNRDLEVVIRDTVIDDEKEELFFRHVVRFDHNIPNSIFDFLSTQPATIPCQNQEICVYGKDGALLAASFLDLGQQATSAVYAMFDPEETKRSLGIFTMLIAIRYSIERGCQFYYPGYAYREPSFYDYKKRFSALNYFDWWGDWIPYQAEETVTSEFS